MYNFFSRLLCKRNARSNKIYYISPSLSILFSKIKKIRPQENTYTHIYLHAHTHTYTHIHVRVNSVNECVTFSQSNKQAYAYTMCAYIGICLRTTYKRYIYCMLSVWRNDFYLHSVCVSVSVSNKSTERKGSSGSSSSRTNNYSNNKESSHSFRWHVNEVTLTTSVRVT